MRKRLAGGARSWPGSFKAEAREEAEGDEGAGPPTSPRGGGAGSKAQGPPPELPDTASPELRRLFGAAVVIQAALRGSLTRYAMVAMAEVPEGRAGGAKGEGIRKGKSEGRFTSHQHNRARPTLLIIYVVCLWPTFLIRVL